MIARPEPDTARTVRPAAPRRRRIRRAAASTRGRSTPDDGATDGTANGLIPDGLAATDLSTALTQPEITAANIAEPTGRASPQVVIGWREWVSLPDLGVPLVKAKVDTGARSCALHAFDLEEFRRDGVRWVRFTVHPWQRDVDMTIRAECRLLGERSVRSSHGHQEVRPVVLSQVVVGNLRVAVELTLTNRDAMGFRMLLGRSAVRGRFVVDPGRSFVQRQPSSTAVLSPAPSAS